jgi:hypothetical protein
MTALLADHIRDAHDNLKAGIEVMRKAEVVRIIPPEIHKAMHALSYAVKAVEATGPAYDEGITFAIVQLADLTGAKDWQIKDGSEDHDTDVRDTIMDVLKCAGLYDDETGNFTASDQQYLEMLWNWFEERCDLSAERREGHGFTAEDFRIMLDEHEAALMAPQAADAKAEPLRDREALAYKIENILDDTLSIDLTDEEIIGIGPACYTIADVVLTTAPTAVDRTAVIEEVIAERGRQIAKGYDADHDDAHYDGSIATAAAVYALHPFAWHLVITEGSKRRLLSLADFWPWEWSQFEPADERRNLVRSAAMIIAEIERLDRTLVDAKGDGTAGEGR